MDLQLIIKWLLVSALILILSLIIPGIKIKGYLEALLVSLGLAVVNIYLEPIILRITSPINAMTYGIFAFIVNALLILLVSAILPGFKVKNFWSALIFSLGLAIAFYFIPNLKF
ncbi:MAG: phage holin family protein [Candidatus Moranbacteria bacterium]|nr:phage holin family protein [Candidatus Moranbacteria bacterium]